MRYGWGLVLLLVGACASGHKEPVQPMGEALALFPVAEAFHSQATKTLYRDGKFYSLVHSTKTLGSEGTSAVVVHDKSGKGLDTRALPKGFNVIDFDFLPDGHLVELGTSSDPSVKKYDQPLQELSVFVEGEKLFTFTDSRHDSNEDFDPKRTLFLNYSDTRAYARIKADGDRLFIAASGTHSTKLLSFDYTGHELAQVEIFPPPASDDFISLLPEAAFIDITQGRIVAAVSRKGQVAMRSWNLDLSDRKEEQVKSSDYLNVRGIAVQDDKIAVFGEAGAHGHRDALVVLTDSLLHSPRVYTQDIGNEASIQAATFLEETLWIGGEVGSAQVKTGSVVKFGNAFVGTVNSDGKMTVLSRFGTERRDLVHSLMAVEGALYAAGTTEGPITHTADSDPSLGFQKWFLGKWKASSSR